MVAFAACDRRPAARLSVEPATIQLGPGRSVPLRVNWHPSAPLDKPFGRVYVFVHLLDERGELARTFDHPLPAGWKAGETLSYDIDLYESALADPLVPGSYALTMGLYDIEMGYRWPLAVEGEEGKEREYRVATIQAAAGAPNPRYQFAGEWSAPEAYADKQTRMLRWLLGTAQLRLREISEPGTVRLRLKVERDSGVAIRSTCDPGRVLRLPLGSHWVSVPTSAARECEISFSPAAPASGGAALARLEVVAWRPGG
jgi:hypothetical protein